jgi:hypothetical protein
LTCLALGLVVFALGHAAPSFAASAGITAAGTTLSYVAGPGEANNTTVSLSGTDLVITDSGAAGITDAGGCTVSAGPPPQAMCPAAGVTLIRVDLGDGDDTVAVNAQTPAFVLARGGGTDTVTCAGGGTAPADSGDQVTGCESDLPPETILYQAPPGKLNHAPQYTRDFALDSPDLDTIGFECQFAPATGFGPCEGITLPDGAYTLEARAIDEFGADPTPVSAAFEVDTTAPETAINGGPDPESDNSSPVISFIADGADAVGFECKLDDEDWRSCRPPASYSDLAVGTHTFSVRAIDDVGNADPTEATVTFRITSKPVHASGPPTGLIVVRPPASFVLIGGSTIRVSRKRIATVKLNCAGNRDCAGELTLTTAKRIRLARKRRGSRSLRRYVRLGGATFFIPAPRSLTIRIPLTKRAFRIVRKRKRIKTTITVSDKDRVGRSRISTREVYLRAR